MENRIILKDIKSDEEITDLLENGLDVIFETFDSLDVLLKQYPSLKYFKNYKIYQLPDLNEIRIQKNLIKSDEDYRNKERLLKQHGKLSKNEYIKIINMIKNKSNVLFCDDDIDDALLIRDYSKKIFVLNKANEAVNLLSNESKYIKLAIIDIQFKNEDLDGLDILKKIKQINPSVKVIMLSGFDDLISAFKVFMLSGDFFISKSNFHIDYLNSVIEFIMVEGFSFIVGKSKAMIDLYKKILFYSKLNNDVFISGENGTGKELVAKAIHFLGRRDSLLNCPFIAYNCAGIPDSLFEGEMFGYEKGAFTGAIGEKKSPFLLAKKGVLFLDEIGDMSLYQQAKLLRVIQEKKVLPLGSKSNHPFDISCRLIYATNKILTEEIEQKRFRVDLYYRITDSSIEVPSLNQRIEDIDLLIAYFISRFIKRNNLDQLMLNHFTDLKIDENSIEQLKQYSFPGNIRELEKIVNQSVINYLMSESKMITFNIPKKEKIEISDAYKPSLFSMEMILSLILNRIVKFEALYDDVKYQLIQFLEQKYDSREVISELLMIKKASLNNFISLYKKNKK